MLLVYLSVAWVTGIYLGSAFDLPLIALLVGLAPLALARLTGRRRKPVFAAGLCLVLLLLGASYYRARLPFADEIAPAVPWIDRLREDLGGVLARVLPEPQAALAQGIILGTRSGIPDSLLDEFSRTGTTHILAVSGQNLSIVAGILVSLGVWLFGRKHGIYIWLALATLWLYTLLTGAQPPVVRGAVMASVFLFADLLGRQRSAFVGLVFAAALMVGVNPGILWDLSFQLSFLAMTGLVFITPPLQAVGRKIVEEKLGEGGTLVSAAEFIVDSLSVSLGATAAVWPLIAHYFGMISWVGPLATMIAVPVFPGIIVAGATAGAVGLVALPVAQVIAWVAWLFLSYMLLVVKVFSFVPATEGARIDATAILIYYAVLAFSIWLVGRKDRIVKARDWIISASTMVSRVVGRLPLKQVVPVLGVAAILVWLAVFTLPDDKLHASFLDVGQGDATLFQKGSRQILIDGGPAPGAIGLALGEEMPFWDRTIDLVILTHPDADHLDGLVEVLKRYRVGQVLYARPDEQSPAYAEWSGQINEFLTFVEQKHIKSTVARVGQQISFGSATLEVLNPPESFLAKADSDIDNNGVVVRLEIGAVSFLITGDVQRQGEADLVANRAKLASTVLKAGHHGSRTSTNQAFLEAVDPSVAIISAGKDNPYGHPHKEVVDRLKMNISEENIYRTDLSGTIELITDGTYLWVKTKK